MKPTRVLAVSCSTSSPRTTMSLSTKGSDQRNGNTELRPLPHRYVLAKSRRLLSWSGHTTLSFTQTTLVAEPSSIATERDQEPRSRLLMFSDDEANLDGYTRSIYHFLPLLNKPKRTTNLEQACGKKRLAFLLKLTQAFTEFSHIKCAQPRSICYCLM